MSTFPLFDSLYTDAQHFEFVECKNEMKDFILHHIQDLDENGREIFFAIIRQYQILYEKPMSSDLPLYCKQLKSGIRIDFDKIPNVVKYMLHHFIKRHLHKMNEDVLFFKSSF